MARLLALWSVVFLLATGALVAYIVLAPSGRPSPHDVAVAPRDTLQMERANARALGLWLNFKEDASAPLRVSLPPWPVVATWCALFVLCSTALGVRIHDVAKQHRRDRPPPADTRPRQ